MQQLSLSSKSREFSALEFGQSDKPLMIAIHGWLDNAASFSPIAEYLEDYRIVAIDMAGHGHSDHRSDDAHYHFIDWLQDIYEIMEVQHWPEAIFLGHSMGGIIASMFAGVFPEKVSKLICIEALGPLVKPEDTTVDQIRNSIESRAKIKDKPMRMHQSLDSAIQARAMAGDFDRDVARILVERNIKKLDEGYLWRTDQRLKTLSSLRMTDAQAKVILTSITADTLIIGGEKGYEELKALIDQRMPMVANAVYKELPGGHHLHMEFPNQVAEQIRSFL